MFKMPKYVKIKAKKIVETAIMIVKVPNIEKRSFQKLNLFPLLKSELALLKNVFPQN
jgi:hypothetical protein